MISPINKSMGNIYLKKEGKIINSANFEKLINILDPINNYNNLGKSINYHSKSKMKKIIIYMNQQMKYIHKIRKKGNLFLYINSLFNLFRHTISHICKLCKFSKNYVKFKIIPKFKKK